MGREQAGKTAKKDSGLPLEEISELSPPYTPQRETGPGFSLEHEPIED